MRELARVRRSDGMSGCNAITNEIRASSLPIKRKLAKSRVVRFTISDKSCNHFSMRFIRDDTTNGSLIKIFEKKDKKKKEKKREKKIMYKNYICIP